MHTDMEDQSLFGPLTDSEKARFLESGTGSDSGGKWLDAVLMTVSGGADSLFGTTKPPMIIHTEDREDRGRILSEGFRHAVSQTLAFEESLSQKGWHVMMASGPVERMEPMTAWSADTLIRFSMTRHDATDMLCSERIGDPVGAMMHTVRVMPENGRMPALHGNAVCPHMNRHMALPIATHPFSALQDIVNAVCYGAHGNGRIDRSRVTGPGLPLTEMAPLSGSMEYSGPDCDPRLMAMMLSADAVSAIGRHCEETEMIVSMPGVETIGIPGAVSELTERLSGLGALAPFTPANPSPNMVRRLPAADYGTMMGAIGSGRYEEIVPCMDATGHMPDFGSGLHAKAMRDHRRPDGLPHADDNPATPDTYAMMSERIFKRTPLDANRKESGYDYGIMPGMADIAWALTFPRPEHTDPTLLHDMLMTAFTDDRYAPADEALILSGAGAWSGFTKSLPLRDPILSDAALSATKMMIDLAEWLISRFRSLPSGRIGIMLIPMQALDRFFTDLHHGLSADFALQTLISGSFTGEDRQRDPGFHGLLLIMPYEIKKNGAVSAYRWNPSNPISGTVDAMHPDVLMLP